MKKAILILVVCIFKLTYTYAQCEMKFIKNPGPASGDVEIEMSNCKNKDYNGYFKGHSTYVSSEDIIINGKFTGNNGNFVFEGDLMNKKKCGDAGFCSGKATIHSHSSDGSDIEYVGDFKDDNKTGWGSMKNTNGFAKGTNYSGYWKDGLPDKYGKLTIFFDESKKAIQNDNSKDDQKYFSFICKYSKNGDIYAGEWGNFGLDGSGIVKISYKGYGIYYSKNNEPESGIWIGKDSLLPRPEKEVVDYLNKKYKLNLKVSIDPIIKEEKKAKDAAELEKTRVKAVEQQNNLSGSIKTDVSAEIVNEPDERGNLKKNLKITYKYDVIKAKIGNQTNDFLGGHYRLSDSKAASLIMDEFKKGCEQNDSLNSYLKPGIRIDFKITGSTDGTPILKTIPYNEDYGSYSPFEGIINNNFGSITVNKTTGIKTNEQLALLRCVGVQRYIENLVTPLKNTNNSFEFNIITFKQTGDSLRRIAVEMTIHDPFKQARIKEITRVSDVDTLHFKYKPVNPNAIAVVIGNTDYGQNAPMRDFGVNDAISVKNYLVGLCGYKDGNINLKTDVTLNVMRTIFGTEDSPEGWLADHSNENTDVFIYFSGHGAPGVKNNKCYLMPVDCNPNYAQSSGYSLDLLYKNLSLIKAKNVFIVIDACFSAQILQGVSPIHTKPIDPVNNIPNGISITASESYAMDFPEKMHTMLTYFFLKAMKDSYTTDISPKNGKVSIQEIFNYISNGNSGVPYESRRISKSLVTQKPVMKGTGDKERVFVVK